MTKKTSSEVIEAYRKRRKNRFNTADIVKGLVILLILAISIYIVSSGSPVLSALVDLKTNTPIIIPSFTPQPNLIPTGNPADEECNCLPPQEISSQPVVTIIVVVTPTSDTGTSSTETLSPAITHTPTPHRYVVQPNDTLGDIALRFNVTVEAIQVVNGMGSSTLIVVGQTLIIPK